MEPNCDPSVFGCCWWLTWLSPRWALNDQCTLQALPWNNRSLEDFAAFVPKKCLESKKKKTTVQTQRFTTVFLPSFFLGGRSMGGGFWIFLMIFKTCICLSIQVHWARKTTCIQKTTPEGFALSSTGISILISTQHLPARWVGWKMTAVTERIQYPSIGNFSEMDSFERNGRCT